MGIPQMAELWQELQVSYRNGSISKKRYSFIQKMGKSIKIAI